MGLFIAAGHKGTRLVSRDGGKTWGEPVTGKDGEVYRGIVCGGGKAVAFGSYGGDNIFAVTADGQNWQTAKKDAGYSRYVLGAVWANNAFHGYGGDRTSVGAANVFHLHSIDGTTWSDFEKTEPDKVNLYRIAFNGQRYVAVGMRGRRSMSQDGQKWQDAPNCRPKETLIDIASGNGVFVGVGLHGLRMTTRDGVQWSEPLRGEEGEHLNSVVWTGKLFVAVGLGATYLSPDGQQWERKPNQNAPVVVAYGDGVFLGARWKGRLVRSTDSIQWDEVKKCDEHLETLGYLPV